ncbi:MarR family transcriptional regulator [Pseudomonas sp. B21-015]|uniref:MarR family winged helix-turn-helix transcriptional regulator n=1 Tax=Pseudomonas sp. B21-015 TaxID=2895473 RepID=UPI002160EACE|nr:MarR family transcriptional regulator [Pseudomonas sp. B21-015]UVM50479.1 MarR family transcriptional regulator [Pseudomonas sp. B21-015]
MARNSNAEPVLRNLFCFNFYRGWRGISEFYRKYLPEGISAQQSYLLELCQTDKGILVGDIAHQLEIDISAVSGLLKRMEGSSLIRREVLPSNRRQTLVFLTLQGKSYVRKSISR